MAEVMYKGSFMGTSDIGTTVRISEYPEYIIIKNYTANSEIKITKKIRKKKRLKKQLA